MCRAVSNGKFNSDLNKEWVYWPFIGRNLKPGMVVQIYNPSTLGSRGRGLQVRAQSGQPMRYCLKIKQDVPQDPERQSQRDKGQRETETEKQKLEVGSLGDNCRSPGVSSLSSCLS